MGSENRDITFAGGFAKILNFRDAADFVNTHSGGPSLRTGLLYRSARPDLATKEDRELLTKKYGIRTILDLRSKTEHIEAAKKVTAAAKLAQPEIVPSTSDAAATPYKLPNIRYAEINLNGKGFERHLVWQLSYSNLARLIGNMTFGYRLEGISILGKNVLQPLGLTGLARETLKHSGPEIKEIFDVLSTESAYPVLVHCTQGKDRTGLTILLVLLLCGADIHAMTQDYVLSEQELKPEFEERLKEIKSIGLDEEFAKCPADFVERTVRFINEEYGGIEKYLHHIGVSDTQIATVKKTLRT